VRAVTLALAIIAMVAVDFATAQTTTLLYTSDFETGSIKGEATDPDGWSQQNGDVPDATTVLCGEAAVNPSPRSGSCLIRYTLDKRNWNGTAGYFQGTTDKPRAQLSKSVNGVAGMVKGVEYWVGVSTYHPADWQFDTNADNQTVFWQFHGAGGAAGQSPPLVATLRGQTLEITSRSGNISISSQYVSENIWTGPLELGKWTDWIIHVRFETTGTDGYVQVWRNGVLIANKLNQPTIAYTDAPSTTDKAYPCLSLYKGRFVIFPTSVTRNVMYYDSFRVASGPDGKAMVDPVNFAAPPAGCS